MQLKQIFLSIILMILGVYCQLLLGHGAERTNLDTDIISPHGTDPHDTEFLEQENLVQVLITLQNTMPENSNALQKLLDTIYREKKFWSKVEKGYGVIKIVGGLAIIIWLLYQLFSDSQDNGGKNRDRERHRDDTRQMHEGRQQTSTSLPDNPPNNPGASMAPPPPAAQPPQAMSHNQPPSPQANLMQNAPVSSPQPEHVQSLREESRQFQEGWGSGLPRTYIDNVNATRYVLRALPDNDLLQIVMQEIEQARVSGIII